jgi:hypothetical protein
MDVNELEAMVCAILAGGIIAKNADFAVLSNKEEAAVGLYRRIRQAMHSTGGPLKDLP